MRAPVPALSAQKSASAAAPTAGAPKVSVLLPTYNRAHVLGRAIDSILAQTLTDWELIVVDDGSTDETQALMQHYCAKDSRIHYVRQPNGGQARAQNMGLRLARGEYLHKQDDDDFAYADKLMKCAAALDERTDRDSVLVRWRVYSGTRARGWRLEQLRYMLPLFFRMTCVRAAGGWHEFYKSQEDWALVQQIQMRAGRTVNRRDIWVKLEDILYDYTRVGDDNSVIHWERKSAAPLYGMVQNSVMRPLYRWGLPDMVQPHWDLRRALKQIYFLRRHACLPAICYAHWKENRHWTRRLLRLLPEQRKIMMRKATTAHWHFSWLPFSWRLLWKAQRQLWQKARTQYVPWRWHLRIAWGLTRYYFAARPWQQVYFVHRHAFLPAICYVHWEENRHCARWLLEFLQKKRKKMLRRATRAHLHFSWRLLWKAQRQLWQKARAEHVPWRWRLRTAWRLTRCYFSSRRQARMHKSRQAKKP